MHRHGQKIKFSIFDLSSSLLLLKIICLTLLTVIFHLMFSWKISYFMCYYLFILFFLSSDFSKSSISRQRLSYSLPLLCFVPGIFTLFWYRYLYLVTKYPDLQLFFSLVHNCDFQRIFPSFEELKNLTQTRHNCAVFIKDAKIVLYFQKDTMIVPSLQKDITGKNFV